jgi:hypothetical protein
LTRRRKAQFGEAIQRSPARFAQPWQMGPCEVPLAPLEFVAVAIMGLDIHRDFRNLASAIRCGDGGLLRLNCGVWFGAGRAAATPVTRSRGARVSHVLTGMW